MAILKVANIHHDASGFTRTQISTANTITFYTSNQERVSINASGYMQVAGEINAASLLINGIAASNISNSYAASVGVAANSYAMTWANSKFLANTSGVFNGNLTISGNVTTTGSIELGNATDTTISRISAGNVAIEGNVIYRAGGTDVGLADGGTGASLTDPNADRIMFWDDSATSMAWLEIGTGLSISGTVLSSPTFPSGTKMLFAQTAAPTGWTKDTTHDNKALRVVSGTAGSGGSVAFTTAFASQAVSGTVGSTTLTTTQMPSHNHRQNVSANPNTGGPGYRQDFNLDSSGLSVFPQGISTDYAGGSQSHNHSFTGTAINLDVQYVDVIIATKD